MSAVQTTLLFIKYLSADAVFSLKNFLILLYDSHNSLVNNLMFLLRISFHLLFSPFSFPLFYTILELNAFYHLILSRLFPTTKNKFYVGFFNILYKFKIFRYLNTTNLNVRTFNKLANQVRTSQKRNKQLLQSS